MNIHQLKYLVGFLNVITSYSHIKDIKEVHKLRCFICNEKIKGLGNNGLPITTMTVCDEWNKRYIIPLRLFYYLKIIFLLN